ncbi:hypothetical protein [Kitasatospora sp. NPDC059827]|uniref:hypothetical protein n=1 Tax=Kitasatospora sp. NPDC059827 TaxID=3346964 RepID=UPI0036552132
MTGGHRQALDGTPWPERAELAYGARVELTSPEPPVPELGWLGAELVGSRGVVVDCEVERDERDGRLGPVYGVVTEDGSPWRLRPEFLRALGGEPADLPPRHRGDLPEGTRVRIPVDPAPEGGPTGAGTTGAGPAGSVAGSSPVTAVGEVTGLWWESRLEPPKGYTVEVGDRTHCVTPDQVERL